MEHQNSGKGGGPQKRMEGRKGRVKEGSPSIKLGLGIGGDDSVQNRLITQHKKKKNCVVFTAAQLHELQQQSLIFKYMVARLPVPLHLVIPIWTSVASSFGSENGGIYKQFPSFVGFCPEAERCRRTDGKKWRCSKNVVPDQKYCERHMHRGRKRSRKLVEASEIAPPFDTTPPNNSNEYSENSNTISTPASFQPMTPFSSNTITSQRTSTTTTTIGGDNNGIGNNPSTINTTPTAIAANTTTSTVAMSTSSPTPTTINFSTTPTPTTTNNNSCSKTNHNLDGKAVNQSGKNRSNMNIRGNISTGLDFSPKSVLQVQGCSGSYFCRSDIELEPGRCRRTDGKKWRCSRDVVPEQKYCAQHMHRGAKKHVEASQLAAVLSAARRPHTKTVPNEANYATPNTNLSISIPASPQLMTNDEKSTNSSGSDTTITDTTINAYEIGNFSS